MTGLPFSNGSSSTSTDAKNASMSTCRIVASCLTELSLGAAPPDPSPDGELALARPGCSLAALASQLRVSTSAEDAVADAPPRDEREGLDHDVARHLRLAPHPLGEGDRDLDDRATGPRYPMGHLDLEAVAVGPHGAQIDLLEHDGAVGPEAGGRVVHVE